MEHSSSSPPNIMSTKRSSRLHVEEPPHPLEMVDASIDRSRHGSLSSGRDQFAQPVLDTSDEDLHLRKDADKAHMGTSRLFEKQARSPPPLLSGRQVDFPPAPLNGRPTNFGVVSPGVYRSGYPTPEDFGYLRELHLKTIVTLVKKEEMDAKLGEFATQNGINQVIFNIRGTKKESIPPSAMSAILDVVLDPRNYPLLIHCNHGKHRTGCVVASMRRTAGWEVQHALNEYRAYAEPKVRDCDVEYISHFDQTLLSGPAAVTADMAIQQYSRLTPVQLRSLKRALGIAGVIMFLCVISGKQFMLTPDINVG